MNETTITSSIYEPYRPKPVVYGFYQSPIDAELAKFEQARLRYLDVARVRLMTISPLPPKRIESQTEGPIFTRFRLNRREHQRSECG